MKLTLKLAGAAFLIAALCATSAVGTAQKGGADGSTIFYHGLSSYSVYRMNSDGTAKTAMFTFPSTTDTPLCSSTLHNGKRWFMQKVDPGTLGTYAPALQFFSESGEMREFPLDFSSVDPEIMSQFRWVPGDQEISFVDRRIVGGVVVEAGIYAVRVQYLNGAPTGISTPYLKVSTPTTIDGELGIIPAVGGGYDWSPDGMSLVFSGGGLYILDSAGVRLIRNAGHTPRWASGTVNRIAYIEGLAICTIGTNGSGWKSVLSVSSTQQNQKWLATPEWSPNGASIAYTLWTFSNSQGFGCNLYKVAATGSGNTKLGPVYRAIAWK